MRIHIRSKLGIQELIIMYVGNLEIYQGVDLLLESFALTSAKTDQAKLVVIGGEQADIQKYQNQAENLGIRDHVYFLGPKPVDDLGYYLSQADILVSPRVKGKNTPMKLYSYLDSGKPLVATNLATHTQVLTPKLAILTNPEPQAFAAGLLRLIEDENLRMQLGTAGKQLIEQKHTYAAFRRRLSGLYDWLQDEITPTSTPQMLSDSV
jgi:glycosyltransferase involved in cell wall biosynthesis